jgi:putative heme iron utilization protein
VPEPTYAEQARTLVHLGRLGTLSTLSLKQAGTPFGSVTPYGSDERGQPLFLISSMAMHTQNLQADPRASLLVAEASTPDDALGAGRVTLLGEARKIQEENEAELAEVRRRYLAAYPNAQYWVDFDDFCFYRLKVNDVYFVGGFGVMGWVTAEDYLAAEADPLVDRRQGIIEHMNTDHAEALVQLAQHYGTEETKGVEEARMTAVDRLGFHLRLKTGDRFHGTRIAFLREARTPEECREVLVEMVRRARGG